MHFKEELGVDACPTDCDMVPQDLLFATYHHSTDSLHDADGKCRLIFAPNALPGYGSEFPRH